MKCSILMHFIWDFTVCKSTGLVFSSLQVVKVNKMHMKIWPGKFHNHRLQTKPRRSEEEPQSTTVT